MKALQIKVIQVMLHNTLMAENSKSKFNHNLH